MIGQYRIFGMLVQVLLLQQVLFAGFDRVPQPANLFAKGSSGIALFNSAALWINPASLAKNSSITSTFFYSPSGFQLQQLANSGIISSVPTKYGIAGIGISTFGFSLYRETVGALSYSLMVTDNVALGATLNFNHLSIERYGTDLSVGADVGAILSPIKDVTVGIVLQNINRPRIGTSGEEIPLRYCTGIGYIFSDLAILNVDVIKDVRYPLEYKGGIDLLLHQHFILHGGISTEPERMFAGLSIPYLFFKIEYGYATHKELGATHSFGISFSL